MPSAEWWPLSDTPAAVVFSTVVTGLVSVGAAGAGVMAIGLGWTVTATVFLARGADAPAPSVLVVFADVSALVSAACLLVCLLGLALLVLAVTAAARAAILTGAVVPLRITWRGPVHPLPAGAD